MSLIKSTLPAEETSPADCSPNSLIESQSEIRNHSAESLNYITVETPILGASQPVVISLAVTWPRCIPNAHLGHSLLKSPANPLLGSPPIGGAGKSNTKPNNYRLLLLQSCQTAQWPIQCHSKPLAAGDSLCGSSTVPHELNSSCHACDQHKRSKASWHMPGFTVLALSKQTPSV